MKKHITSTIVAILSLSAFAGSLYAGTYSGGTGEPNSPYKIGTVADWQELMATPADWNKSFLLTADIDLAGISLIPVGNDETQFTGIFDGNNHVIRSASVNLPDEDYMGVFGYVRDGGQIRNFGVESINIAGKGTVGGLVGKNEGSIISCYSTGTVSGGDNVGGLVGFNGSSLTSCYSTGNVSGNLWVGGLVGKNSYLSSLTSCYSTGNVSGSDWVGGLTGSNGNTMTSCYSTGSVTGDGLVGGLVGENSGSGSLILCYATGNVSGSYLVGGLAGSNLGGTITFCRSAGTVSGTGTVVGGLVGSNWSNGSLTSCHSTGSVTGIGMIGGLVGENFSHSSLTSCYSTGSVSGGAAVGGLVGGNGSNSSLTACYSTGNVTGGNNSGGTGIGGLVGKNYNSSSLTACYATGNVTGSYSSNSVGGLVGKNYYNSSLTSCYATGNVTGNIWAGGLVGYNSDSSSLIACYSTGNVTSDNDAGGNGIGGLVGYNYSSSLTACYAMGNVSGIGNGLGGLVGNNYNHSSITSCYSVGTVSGKTAKSDFVGGLVGNNGSDSSLTACYSTGAVSGTSHYVGGLVGSNYSGLITACFWDIQTSGMTTSAGGTGKTTAEMKTKSTFTSAGWDFINVWKIKEHIDYPRLIWENTSPVACIADVNETIEAQGPFGAKVVLDGSCSSDADSAPGTNDDINDFNWYEIDECSEAVSLPALSLSNGSNLPEDSNEIYLGSGEILDCNLPLGEHTILLEVTDKAGATDSNEITVTVEDTTPPEIELSVTPNILWPPNGKMIEITPACIASDICDPEPGISLVGITMNEPGNADDIRIDSDGSIHLCATRSGNSKGRIYTLTYQACDESGNCTTQSAAVTVPHDWRK